VTIAEGANGSSGGGRSHTVTIVFSLIVLVVVALLIAFAVQMHRSTAAPEPGTAAPDFELETYEGDTIRLSDLRGKVVVLNFWASWCAPCAVEAAELEALWRDYADRDVVVLGIDYEDTRPAALTYLEKHGVSYPNGLDRADVIARKYHLGGVPETFVIDRQGRVVPLVVDPGEVPVAKIVGPVTQTSSFTPRELREVIDDLLANGEGSP
jgi:cytochrome c biogenesis protein CcmG/thiol:disulfide interchange protein DsbE